MQQNRWPGSPNPCGTSLQSVILITVFVCSMHTVCISFVHSVVLLISYISVLLLEHCFASFEQLCLKCLTFCVFQHISFIRAQRPSPTLVVHVCVYVFYVYINLYREESSSAFNWSFANCMSWFSTFQLVQINWELNMHRPNNVEQDVTDYCFFLISMKLFLIQILLLNQLLSVVSRKLN